MYKLMYIQNYTILDENYNPQKRSYKSKKY